MKDFKKALNYSFLLLKYRARSKKEISGRLSAKRFPASVTKKVIDYLEENNYINDEEFIRDFISSSLKRGWGKARISFALKNLGIAQQLIHDAKNEIDEKPAIRELIKERIEKLKGSGNVRSKIFRYLKNRGFDAQLIVEEIERMDI